MSLLPFNSLILLLIWSLVGDGMKDLSEPKVEALQGNPRMPVNPAISFNAPLSNVNLPVFPERLDAVYFVVAVTGGAKSWGRALARTIIDMGESFSDPQGPPLRPIYVDLPVSGRFSAKVLTALCEQIEGIPISGVIVVGDGQAARSIVLSGNGMKVPVLWAKGGTAQLYAGESETRSYLQATLQPSAKEILEAIRAIFIQTHWHSFFVLSDIGSAMILGGSLGNILKKSPLLPTIFPLSNNKDDVFRQLAKISRSTRGIVLLLCDLNDARRVMSEAQRLKMTGGHFIWIWADTSSTAEFFQQSDIDEKDQTKANMEQQLGQINLRSQKFGEPSSNRQYFQQPFGGNSKRQNNTRQKTTSNQNVFHHIIGLRRPGDELSGDVGIPALMPEKNFVVPIKEKRSDDGKTRGGFNGFDFDQSHRHNVDDSLENTSGDENGDSTNMNYDYDKINPFLAENEGDSLARPTSSSSPTTTRRNNMPLDVKTNEKSSTKKVDIHKTPNVNRNINSNKNSFSSLPEQSPKASFFDDIDDLDLEEYNDANDADLKAKRADNLPSAFNISSHVFFHHYKDFPVGLLALRHIKMNVDRVFVRSAVRLFASTWSRVERDESLRMSGKISSPGRKTNWYDNWQDYDYEDVVYKSNKNNKQNRKQKPKSNVNVNSRHNNARGSRKYRRDVEEVTNTNSNLVNSSVKYNDSNQISNLTHIEHLSDLKLQTSDELVIKSNNKNNITNSNASDVDEDKNRTKEVANNLNLDGKIEVNKRQNGFWSSANRAKMTPSPTDKTKSSSRGTPQYIGGCYGIPSRSDVKRSELFARYLKEAVTLALSGRNMPGGQVTEKPLVSNFELLNLVPSFDQQQKRQREKLKKEGSESTKWRRVGLVLGRKVHLDTIVWPGGDIVVSGLSARARSVFRVVTSLSPPFVMESNLDEDGLCLRGLPCHRISTSVKHNMTLMFNSIETKERYEEDAVEHGNQIPLSEDHKSSEKSSYKTRCCYGLSMDLLDNVASELGFGYILYIVGDELFGSKELRREDFFENFERIHPHQQQDFMYERQRENERIERHDRQFHKKIQDHSVWNGIVGDLVVGTADMSFAPLSVSKSRSDVIDFSTPYFHSGVSLLAAPKVKTDIPLLAFLMPFSPELWIAIFIWLNLTAVAVAIYEWLSPFGLNPWGRMRSKNFSLSSALWVMWGLLCGHLVAFKAPKSWPNKFLINVWGGFSVIFIASYTANIAALIAGLFFQNSANTYDSSLMTQRVGIPRSSAAESYVQRNDRHLYERMKKYMFSSIEEGIKGLKNGSIDLLMADTPILDYYRGSDHGCQLRRIGENYIEDTYAIGMSKGFPLKDSISALIAKYSSNGYLDILMEKWYGGLPCYRDENHIEIVQPRPLGVAAVAGVYLMLGLGMVLGILILIFEHMFFKYYLPILRVQPKGSIWRSRNIMFFSQKLYRFINCVELVSPHHAARELVHTLRKGHITSLFQKSVKRKEDEQRRRRKSKAQFFEMIQEIRRVQQEEKVQPVIPTLAVVEEDEPQTIPSVPSPNPEVQSIASTTSSRPRASPKIFSLKLKRDGHARSNSSTLNIRRFSTDSILGERLDTIGRRLSRDFTNDLTASPPDLGAHRFETFGKTAATSSKFDTFSGKSGITKSADDLDRRGSSRERSKYDTFAGNLDEIKPDLPAKRNSKIKPKRKPLTDVFDNGNLTNNFLNLSRERIIETYRETLHPPVFEFDTSKAVLREKLHEELKEKYGAKTLLRVKPPRVPSTVGRPKIRTHNPNDTFMQTRSKESLIDVRPLPSPKIPTIPKIPSPPRQFSDDDDDDALDPTYATVLPRNKNNGIQLGRLSKEDLLDLSQKSESEINEFLNGKKPGDGRFPPVPP